MQDGGQAIEAARALYWRARVSLKQNRLNEARQDFETSRTTLERLGAVADLQRVDKQLAELTDNVLTFKTFYLGTPRPGQLIGAWCF